ncbi:Maf family nucleotide pyrophosphatase [uncultured Castellaniella sp.]|uniref:Maf family nucleotide pyrophosphatase n=1 Tax=uncultured Castellaniella sp. TaxID=647907 RepID=UPI00260C3D3E|nr:Maf family nucleotide pyrophosphatase [uncultured Castellaniella sp.]
MILILASSSVYRRELLQRLRLPFECHSPDIDERPLPGESPRDLACRLAREKADRVLADHPGALVIGSDQVAACEGRAIGKPGDHESARAQLQSFSGREVLFHTAVCVTDGRSRLLDEVPTRCEFLALDPAQIEHYLRAERPYDTAGSAKAEALGIALMARMNSDDPTALIGLPLIAVCRMLRAFGLDPLQPSLRA